jgi:hypothetical protein
VRARRLARRVGGRRVAPDALQHVDHLGDDLGAGQVVVAL